MKKCFLLALLFISLAIKGYGQYVPLLNDSAVWRQGIQNCYTTGCAGWNYYDLQLNGDTLIGQKLYKIIYDLNGFSPYAYLREDSGKVYVIREPENELPYLNGYLWGSLNNIDTTEFILYDFTLQVGDTFTTRILKCGAYIEWGDDSIEHKQNFILSNIDSVILNNGAIRKQFHFDNPYDDWSSENYFFGEDPIWIEGIGSINTLFYNETGNYQWCGWFDAGYSSFKTACYSLNDTILWGVPNCQFPTSVNEVIAPEKMEVYPNPTTGIITIQGIKENADYSIYNVIGKLIKSGTTTNNQIDVGELAIGMYVLAVTENTTGKIYRSRIIKQ